jgi:hypothetical protein
MQYILLIYASEAMQAKRSEAENNAIFGGYMDYTESIKKSGHYVAGEPLEDTRAATTIRVKDGRRSAPMARSQRHASSSAASTSSKPKTSMKRSRSPRASRTPRTAASKCGR